MDDRERSKILKIDRQNLPYEMEEHPKKIAYYVEILENLNVKRKKSKALYERIRGKVYMRYREKLINDDSKIMSEKYLDALVNSHNKVKEAFDNMLEIERKYQTMRGIVDALHTKTDMLKEMAYLLRAELKQGVLRKAARVKDKIKKGDTYV